MQFALAGGLVMLVAMTGAGAVIAGLLSRAAVDSTAARSALFLESLLSPLVQELVKSDRFSETSIARLNVTLKSGPFIDRFAYVDIWLADGSMPYSTSLELIGQSFETPEAVASAFEGNIEARFTDLSAHEHKARGWSTRYLEIYVPMREEMTAKIIAVVEIHERIEPLHQIMLRQRLHTWLVVIAITMLIGVILIGIVWRGALLEAEQKQALFRRVEEIERISEQNKKLRQKVQQASARRVETEEAKLREFGAEIHDGPAQLVGLAVLKLEHIRRTSFENVREVTLQSVESVLREAMQGMRDIARGLMLPEIEGKPLHETINSAARAHERRTNTQVTVSCDEFSDPVPAALNICTYRFVQEGLNNAFRHAGAANQEVECRLVGRRVRVRVSDAGAEHKVTSGGEGIGLRGLRERVESLGGTFTKQQTAAGTVIEMRVELDKAEEA